MNLDAYKRAGFTVFQVDRVALMRNPHGTEYVAFTCPGCGEDHSLPVSMDTAWAGAWGFNGDVHAPTLTPSILCRYHAFNEATEQYDQLASVCHSFVRNGQIEFLGDCTHPLRGQTVALAEIEAT